MKIKSAFENSYNQLLKNKELIIPFILIYLTAGVIFGIFFYASGTQELFKELYFLQNQYQKELLQGNQDFFINLETREDFLSKTNYDLAGKLFAVVNKSNLVFLVITVLVIIAGSFYFITASRVATSLVIKKKKLSIKNITLLTHKLFFRNLWLSIFLFLIFGFIGLGITIPIMSSLVFIDVIVNWEDFVLFVIITVILSFCAGIYLGIKLFFSEASLFLEEKTVFKSIKQSFAVSKGKKLNIFLLILFVWGIQVVFSMISPPISLDLFFSLTIFNFIKTFIIAIMVLLFQGILSAFTTLFVFNSYLEFKKIK